MTRKPPGRAAKVMMYAIAGEIITWIFCVGLPAAFLHPHLGILQAFTWSFSMVVIGVAAGILVAYRRNV